MKTPSVAANTSINAQNPWPGLSAFDEEAERFFNGRDAESAELLRLVGQAPLTVLFGKSGLGKTSLMQAGLFPRLRQQNIFPVYVRLDVRDRSAPLIERAAAALQTEIDKHGVDAPRPKADESLWEHLHGREVAWWSRRNQSLTPLFVFDQFEEVFTLGSENAEAIERLRLDLADLIENRIPVNLAQRIEAGASADHLDLRGLRYKVVLSFREDFLPDVEGWKGELPSLMRNRLRLLPMNAERALHVVSGVTPSGKTHDLVSDETARAIVRFVAAVQTGDEKSGRGKGMHKASDPTWEKLEIEPALLSLVCEGLNEKRKTSGQASIDAALLKETGAAIIGDFYRRCVADVPETTRRFIEDALITEGGFRNSYPLQDALEQGALTERLLRQLVDRRLLRIDHQLGVDRVELIHDRLTDVVREHRNRERERIRARRQRRMWWVAGSVALVLVAIMGVFFSLWQNAQTALREAIAAALVAQSRAILDRQKKETTDIALLLGVASYRLRPENEAYVGLQHALNATPWLSKVLRFPEPVTSLSSDLRTAITMQDRGLQLWDTATGQLRVALQQEPESWMRRIRAIVHWRSATQETNMVSAFWASMLDPTFSPDGRILVSGGARVILWDATTGVRLRTIQSFIGPFAFSPDVTTIVSRSSGNNTLQLLDASTLQPRGALMQGHTEAVASIAFSSDGKTIVSGSYDRTLRLWDASTGQPRGVPLTGHTGSVRHVAFSPDDKTLASGSDDETVRLWDVTTGLPHGVPLTGHTGSVRHVAFCADGKTLASGSDDETVRLWDVTTGLPRGVPLTGHTGSVTHVAFSRDGKSIVSTGDDKTLRHWDPTTVQTHSAPLQGHTNDVMSVAFSPDGKTLASGSADNTLRLWDAATGEPRGTPMQGHTGTVISVAFSPDGKTLASGSADNTLRLWDAATGEPRGTPMQGHP